MSKVVSSRRLLAGLCFIFCQTGCVSHFFPPTYQMYPGPRLTTNNVAVIILRFGSISTSTLDGKIPYPTAHERLTPFTDVWKQGWIRDGVVTIWNQAGILPGPHEVELNFYKSLGQTGNMYYYLASTTPRIVSFSAEAGHKYRVNGDLVGERQWTAYIEDVTSSEPQCVTPKGGRIEFEQQLQKAMSSGKITADTVTITYPDGTERTIEAPPP